LELPITLTFLFLRRAKLEGFTFHKAHSIVEELGSMVTSATEF
jgi:hypothetical protein